MPDLASTRQMLVFFGYEKNQIKSKFVAYL